MDFTLQLDAEHRVLWIAFRGVVTDAAYLAGHAVVKNFNAQHGAHHLICDFSPSQTFNISNNQLRQIAGMDPAVPASMRRIVVAPQIDAYGSARIVQTLRSSSAAKIEIVRMIDDAYALLGINGSGFVAVATD